MIATCTGFDSNGRQKLYAVDKYDKFDATCNIGMLEIDEEVDAVLYSTKDADDTTFNLIYFMDIHKNIISVVQTCGVCYLMDDSGKTFHIIRYHK